MGILLYIICSIVSLIILYTIIKAAVRDGIDRSRTGQIIQSKYDGNEIDLQQRSKKSGFDKFLEDDLDS